MNTLTKKLILPIIILGIWSTSCIEGPTVNQDINVSIPDGKALVIIEFREPSSREADRLNLTMAEYEEYLLSIYGESVTVNVEGRLAGESQAQNFGIFELQLIHNNVSSQDCIQSNGLRLRLEPGRYGLTDIEITGRPIGSFWVYTEDNLEDCKFERVNIPDNI